MISPRIIVADDDPAVRELVTFHLNNEGFSAVAVKDGSAALRQIREGAELAILDLGLPVVDGFGVLRTLRRENLSLPVMVLTGRTDEIDRIVTFELGADDFVVKPFFAREIVCRIRVILRRKEADAELKSRVLRFGRLEIDEAARIARVDGVDAELRPREFSLLLVLAHNAGVALERKTLLQKAWGYDFDGDERTIDSHVRRIRTKLEERLNLPSCLSTIYGYGYKFEAA
jgi:two-component system OmpR family response regulator/two-component system alkaline phosphatase synthesis response regulator PhoP